MTGLLKNLLFALGLAIILWLGYTVFLKEDEGAVLESRNDAIASQAALEAQEFLGRLQQIRKYDLNGSVFNDTRFTSLENFRQELRDEPTGRRNPFAPVE